MDQSTITGYTGLKMPTVTRGSLNIKDIIKNAQKAKARLGRLIDELEDTNNHYSIRNILKDVGFISKKVDKLKIALEIKPTSNLGFDSQAPQTHQGPGRFDLQGDLSVIEKPNKFSGDLDTSTAQLFDELTDSIKERRNVLGNYATDFSKKSSGQRIQHKPEKSEVINIHDSQLVDPSDQIKGSENLQEFARQEKELNDLRSENSSLAQRVKQLEQDRKIELEQRETASRKMQNYKNLISKIRDENSQIGAEYDELEGNYEDLEKKLKEVELELEEARSKLNNPEKISAVINLKGKFSQETEDILNRVQKQRHTFQLTSLDVFKEFKAQVKGRLNKFIGDLNLIVKSLTQKRPDEWYPQIDSSLLRKYKDRIKKVKKEKKIHPQKRQFLALFWSQDIK